MKHLGTTIGVQEILVLIAVVVTVFGTSSTSALNLDWSDKIFRANHHRSPSTGQKENQQILMPITTVRTAKRIRTVQRYARRPLPFESSRKSASYDWIRQLIETRLQDSREKLDQIEESLMATTTTMAPPSVTETVTMPPTVTLKSRYLAENPKEIETVNNIPEASSIELDYIDDSGASQSPETTTVPPTTTTTTMVTTFRPVLVKPGQRSEKIKGQKFAQTIQFHHFHHRWNLLDPLSRYRDAVHHRQIFQHSAKRNNRELESNVNRIETVTASNDHTRNHRAWTFTCPATETAGATFYADLDSNCQAYYHCSGHRRGERFRFMCPDGTRFNERTLNCDWEDNVDCHRQFDLLRA